MKIGDRVPRLDATIWTRVGSRARRSRRGGDRAEAHALFPDGGPRPAEESRSSTVLSGPPTGPGSQASPVAEETRRMVPPLGAHPESHVTRELTVAFPEASP